MVKTDQAEGLRRMLAVPRPRVLSFISVLDDHRKSRMLINLSMALASQGQEVMVVDARCTRHSVGVWMNARFDRCLLDVARQQRTMQEAVKTVVTGLNVTQLCRQSESLEWLPQESVRQLNRVLDMAANHADLMLVDVAPDEQDQFPLSALDDSELMIQVSATPEEIKAAYALIKRLSQRLGRRTFHILVSAASERDARLIYSNMAQAASRYLAVPLQYAGFVPEDEYVVRAAHQGQSVTDAFPNSRAAQSYMALGAALAQQAGMEAVRGMSGQADLGVSLGM
ncbi:antiactivator of flagellar biosynthesis FleN protein [Undibacterium luofuense]|uniref:MinD/ParA family ATP-binding protein n=1 Tax=Undibacterium luofuense TaxID=2828733 RepID=UPI0030ED8F29